MIFFWHNSMISVFKRHILACFSTSAHKALFLFGEYIQYMFLKDKSGRLQCLVRLLISPGLYQMGR